LLKKLQGDLFCGTTNPVLLQTKLCWPVKRSKKMWCGRTCLLFFTAAAASRNSAGN